MYYQIDSSLKLTLIIDDDFGPVMWSRIEDIRRLKSHQFSDMDHSNFKRFFWSRCGVKRKGDYSIYPTDILTKDVYDALMIQYFDEVGIPFLEKDLSQMFLAVANEYLGR